MSRQQHGTFLCVISYYFSSYQKVSNRYRNGRLGQNGGQNEILVEFRPLVKIHRTGFEPVQPLLT